MKCLYPACPHDAKNRGLCRNHISTARTLVKQKKITWAILETNGKALPAGPRHGSVTEWFISGPEPDTKGSLTRADRGQPMTAIEIVKLFPEPGAPFVPPAS